MYFIAPASPVHKTDSYEVSVSSCKDRRLGIALITLTENVHTADHMTLCFTDKDTPLRNASHYISVPRLLRYCPNIEAYTIENNEKTLRLYITRRNAKTENEFLVNLIKDTDLFLMQLDISIDLHRCALARLSSIVNV